MTFTLIYYTAGWGIGPTIELGSVPASGTLVQLSDTSAKEDDEGIYYVDNVMHSEGGNGYLFVRPYTGYGNVAPLTESDRVKSAVDALRKEIASQQQSAERRTELLRNDMADLLNAVGELASAVDNLTDNLMEQLKAEE